MGHIGEDSKISGRVLGEGLADFCGHEIGSSGLFENVSEPVDELWRLQSQPLERAFLAKSKSISRSSSKKLASDSKD